MLIKITGHIPSLATDDDALKIRNSIEEYRQFLIDKHDESFDSPRIKRLDGMMECLEMTHPE